MKGIAVNGSPFATDADEMVDKITDHYLNKLVFGVSVVPMFAKNAKGEELAMDSKAIIRTDNGAHLGFTKGDAPFVNPADINKSIVSFCKKTGANLKGVFSIQNGKRSFYFLQVDEPSKEHHGYIVVGVALDGSMTTFAQAMNYDAKREFIIPAGAAQAVKDFTALDFETFVSELKGYRDIQHQLKGATRLPSEAEILAVNVLQPDLLFQFGEQHAVGITKKQFHGENDTINALLSNEVLRASFQQLLFTKAKRTVRAAVDAINQYPDDSLYNILASIGRWIDHDRARTDEARVNTALVGPTMQQKVELLSQLQVHLANYHTAITKPTLVKRRKAG